MATAQFERSPAGITGKIDWTIPQFSFLEHVHGTLAGTGSMTNFVGDILVTAQSKKEHWSAKTPVSYRAGEALILSKIELDSPLLKANGDLVRRADGFWVGTGLLDQGNLQLIQRIRPSIELYGQSTGSYNLEVIDLEGTLLQAVQADLSANEIYLGTAYAKEASFSLDWREDVKGQIDALLKGVRYEQLLVETAAFQTASGSENWPFHLTVDGTLRDPLQIALDGAWHYRNGEFALTVQSGSGQMLHYPIALSNPASIEWKQGSFLCRDWRGTVGLAELSFNFDGQPSQTDAELKLDRVPLDFLSLNPLDVAVSGTLSLDAKFKERASRVTGDFNASIESLEVKVPGEVDLLFANGTFAGQFDRERLQLKGGLEVRSTPLLTLDLDLPIHFQLWPFEASFLTHKNSAGHLAMNGRIEDFLDFFNLGPHRLEGECTCDLSLRNTLENPRLEGTCDLANGYYQNYITGTELTNIRAELIAEQEHLTLRSLTAQDAVEKGTLAGSGDLLLSAAENFPFKVDLSFQRLNIAQIDLITAEAEGTVSIRGDWNSATARGDVEVIETDMTIPSRLPRQLPNLQVVYKNAPKPIAHTAPHLISTYPLNLDLNVKAPSGVFIGGRGLHSEWKGDFHLGGTYTALAPKGTLQLLSGDFVFASRTFKLSDGTVTLTGKEREMPFIDISATLSEKGVSITARLRGPLDHPQVTLQSVPPLPLSGILSYLLFGQDLSEIDGVQALQLATTVASMAGEGPDVLENTRKSLGIDRLRIITSPSGGDEATDAIALQVGKYVAKGVIVSVSQGAEDSSTNISIEVDLTRGFFLQAESQQQQEQGKFTLKWNRNY
jgi:translocation and assembly module TamB